MNTSCPSVKSNSKKPIHLNYKIGLALILFFSILRFVLVMNANITGKFNYVFPFFLLMWILPFILLDKNGRNQIGIKKTERPFRLIVSFVSGALLCGVVYLTGMWLFGHTMNNWFVYMARPFESTVAAVSSNPSQKLIFFIVSSFIAMSFSPVGEELLYRGIVHESFTPKFGSSNASIIDSAGFAIVHLAHFGIVYLSGSWQLLWIPALLWFIFMFLASRLFYLCKVYADSIYAAILSHAGFNLAMMYFTFYCIL